MLFDKPLLGLSRNSAAVGQRSSSSAVVGQPGPSRFGSPPTAEAAKDYARICELPPLEGSSSQCWEFGEMSDIFPVQCRFVCLRLQLTIFHRKRLIVCVQYLRDTNVVSLRMS